MDEIEVQNLPLTERKSRLTLGLMRMKLNKETKSKDKLDGVRKYNKRTKETARKLEPD
jgi:hypothetical protein